MNTYILLLAWRRTMFRNPSIHWFITHATIVDSNAHQYIYTTKHQHHFKQTIKVTISRWPTSCLTPDERMSDAEEMKFPSEQFKVDSNPLFIR